MTVKDIVIAYLVAHGYDGLYSSGECGCKTDDLMPCLHDAIGDCRPGYFQPCPEDCGEHEWHIGKEKP